MCFDDFGHEFSGEGGGSPRSAKKGEVCWGVLLVPSLLRFLDGMFCCEKFFVCPRFFDKGMFPFFGRGGDGEASYYSASTPRWLCIEIFTNIIYKHPTKFVDEQSSECLKNVFFKFQLTKASYSQGCFPIGCK